MPCNVYKRGRGGGILGKTHPPRKKFLTHFLALEPVKFDLATPRRTYPDPGLRLSREGEGGRRFGTQKFVQQRWPDQIFPIVNFVFSHDGHCGKGPIMQRIQSSHMPLCHRHMVIATSQFSVDCTALQRSPDQLRMLP